MYSIKLNDSPQPALKLIRRELQLWDFVLPSFLLWSQIFSENTANHSYLRARMSEKEPMKTPVNNRSLARVLLQKNDSVPGTPGSTPEGSVHIPATPFLKKLGFGTGVSVFLYSRSPSGTMWNGKSGRACFCSTRQHLDLEKIFFLKDAYFYPLKRFRLRPICVKGGHPL